MSSLRTVVSAVVAWLAVVALGSTAVWVVISRAGDGISSATVPEVTPTTVAPATDRPSPPASGAATPQRRTWQGTGGLVTVQCRGATASLVSASADAGFVVEPVSRGPDEVRVTFDGQGDEGRETSVRARCEHGVPAFQADTQDD